MFRLQNILCNYRQSGIPKAVLGVWDKLRWEEAVMLRMGYKFIVDDGTDGIKGGVF